MTSLKLLNYFLSYLLLISYSEGASRTETGNHCISPCIRASPGEQPTCYYDYNHAERCKPGGDILEYFTTSGEKCNGRCGKFGAKYNWCFNEALSSYNYCDSEPKLLDFLAKYPANSITKQDYCTYKNDPRNYIEKSDARKRRKRQMNNTCNNRCTAGRSLNQVDSIINSIFADDDNFMHMTFEEPSAIVAVATFDAEVDPLSSNRNHRTAQTLTAAMRANIRSVVTTPRGEISDDVYSHLSRMDRERDDEAGHLLAYSLGGPNDETYNFAPQSPMLNRAVRATTTLTLPNGQVDQVIPSCWWDVEALIRRYLRHNPGGRVSWGLVVEYRLYPASRRPTGFRLSLTFFDQFNRLNNYQGEGAVREYYFPNVPTVACADLNHPWWSHWRVNQ